jgi:hypothetical protein
MKGRQAVGSAKKKQLTEELKTPMQRQKLMADQFSSKMPHDAFAPI